MNDSAVIDLQEIDGSAEEDVLDNVHELGVQDLIALTARLAQVLAQEADHLEEMEVSNIAPLQKEKVLLTKALEQMKRHISKHPELLDEMDEETREDLVNVVTVFEQISEESFKRLSMARAVNKRIVDAISDAVKEQSAKEVYDQKGRCDDGSSGSFSVTLNKKV